MSDADDQHRHPDGIPRPTGTPEQRRAERLRLQQERRSRWPTIREELDHIESVRRGVEQMLIRTLPSVRRTKGKKGPKPRQPPGNIGVE